MTVRNCGVLCHASNLSQLLCDLLTSEMCSCVAMWTTRENLNVVVLNLQFFQRMFDLTTITTDEPKYQQKRTKVTRIQQYKANKQPNRDRTVFVALSCARTTFGFGRGSLKFGLSSGSPPKSAENHMNVVLLVGCASRKKSVTSCQILWVLDLLFLLFLRPFSSGRGLLCLIPQLSYLA
jgi:hypothetical protein